MVFETPKALLTSMHRQPAGPAPITTTIPPAFKLESSAPFTTHETGSRSVASSYDTFSGI